MNCRGRAIASSYVGADIQGDVSSMRSPLALPVPSSHTRAFTHPSSVAPKMIFFSAYIDPDALPVPFFSIRALQRQRCEGHASGCGTGSIYETGRSLAGAPVAPKRLNLPSLGRMGLFMCSTGTGCSAGTERSADSNGADDEDAAGAVGVVLRSGLELRCRKPTCPPLGGPPALNYQR